MKMFSAVIVSGALLTVIVGGAAGYSLRSRATAGFDTSIASVRPSATSWTAFSGLAGGAEYRAEHCGGDYVCDEHGAWMAIRMDE